MSDFVGGESSKKFNGLHDLFMNYFSTAKYTSKTFVFSCTSKTNFSYPNTLIFLNTQHIILLILQSFLQTQQSIHVYWLK